MPEEQSWKHRADAAVRGVEEEHQDQHHRHEQPEHVEQADDPPREIGGSGGTQAGWSIGGIRGSFSP